MLLSITTTTRPATDLGWILAKHPDRTHSTRTSHGWAHVFFPEVSEERTTCALVVEANENAPARHPPSAAPALERYLHDRAYATSSDLAVAIAKVFGPALGGRCNPRPELAGIELDLEIEIPTLSAEGDPELVRRMFEPLGWEVELSPQHEFWPVFRPPPPETESSKLFDAIANRVVLGESPTMFTKLRGRSTMRQALAALYLLIPALDGAKPYEVDASERDKLDRHGRGWLNEHPERAWIEDRYLGARSRATRELRQFGEPIDPNWLCWLPGTMSPSGTCAEGPLLEHPRDGLAHYRERGGGRIECTEKHTGTRVSVAVCRSRDVARARFGVTDGRSGRIWDRKGRAPLRADMEDLLLHRVRAACFRADVWQRHASDWILFDAEFVPWNLAPDRVLAEVLVPFSQTARAASSTARFWLKAAYARGAVSSELLSRFRDRESRIATFQDWPFALPDINSPHLTAEQLLDLRSQLREVATRTGRDLSSSTPLVGLAPLNLLAVEGRVHATDDATSQRAFRRSLIELVPNAFLETESRVVDLDDPASVAALERWFDELGESGEGLVMRPEGPLPDDQTQPALKCRTPRGLRLVYGPAFDEPGNLRRLRGRSLERKRALALEQRRLGLLALERFVAGEDPARVREPLQPILDGDEGLDPRL